MFYDDAAAAAAPKLFPWMDGVYSVYIMIAYTPDILDDKTLYMVRRILYNACVGQQLSGFLLFFRLFSVCQSRIFVRSQCPILVVFQ